VRKFSLARLGNMNKMGNMPPTAAHKVAGGVAERNPRYAAPIYTAANGGAQHALLWHPDRVQMLLRFRFRGFRGYAPPPATLCAAVGGENVQENIYAPAPNHS